MIEKSILTQRQIDMVRSSVSKASGKSQFNFYLFHMLIAMPLYMGMDEDEMVALKVSELDFSDTHLRFNGRAVPWHPETKRLFRRYMMYRATRLPQDVEVDTVLIQPNGPLAPPNHDWVLDFYRVTRLFMYLRRASRVKVTLSRLRHTYGYHLALAGAPVHVIMAALGCRYHFAMKCITLASQTVEVDEWYQEAIAPTVRPVKDLK